MGQMGGGFAQGFAQTLLTLGPVIQRNQQERETLELNKKLATASLQKHEAETALLTRKLQTEQGLRELLTLGVPTEGGSSPDFAEGAPFQTRTPFSMSNPQHRQLLMAIDPEFRKEDLKGQLQNQRMTEFANQFGFGAPSATASAQPPVGVGLSNPPVALPGLTPPPGMAPVRGSAAPPAPPAAQGVTVPKRSMTMGPSGPSLTVSQETRDVKTDTGYIDLPGGYKQLWRTITNPVTGEVMKQEPVGAPILQDKLVEAGQIASTYGVKPGTPEASQAMAEIVGALQLPPEQKTAALADIRKRYSASKGPGIEERAQDTARTQKVITEAQTTAAKIQTELQNKPLDGPPAQKYVALESIQRKGVQALEMFRPEYVGKPFIDKFKGEFAKAEKLGPNYTPGALAGAMREFFGNATPEEVAFRRTVLELADDVLRARSGAAISETEYKRITGFLATLTDEPTTFKAAMERVVTETTDQMKTAVKLATTPASKLDPTPKATKGDGNKGEGINLGGPRFRYDPKTNRLIPVKP
ncbi:MAG TPA: hypothetical protein VEA38_00885 [Terriglobales bacterium]|nr:hypothetical protein [Terriglobales bacterium]